MPESAMEPFALPCHIYAHNMVCAYMYLHKEETDRWHHQQLLGTLSASLALQSMSGEVLFLPKTMLQCAQNSVHDSLC